MSRVVSIDGPVISWLLGLAGPLGKRVKERLAADHLAITNVQAYPAQPYMAY
jgi:hypothetical protein